MKIRNAFLCFSSLIILLVFTTACRRDRNKDKEDTNSAEQAVFSNDESRYSSEIDRVMEDAEGLFSNSSLAGAKVAAYTVCGATVDSANFATNKKMTLTFDNATSCVGNTVKRDGQIEIELTSGSNWNQAGAEIIITFSNYKVTRIADNKSLTLDGVKIITNVNGGLVRNLGTTGSVVHRIQSYGMTLTFDNGTSRTWQIDRLRTITKSGSDYIATITGNTSQGGYDDVAIWGTTRFGSLFYTTIDTPVKISTCSGFNRPKAISGVKNHRGPNKTITVTFGVNQDGTSNGSCSSYGFKVNWEGVGGTQKQAVISY